MLLPQVYVDTVGGDANKVADSGCPLAPICLNSVVVTSKKDVYLTLFFRHRLILPPTCQALHL